MRVARPFFVRNKSLNHENNLFIRDASIADVDPLVELSHRTVLTKYPSVIGAEMVQGYVASGAVPTYYRAHIDQCRVAELGGAVVGCVAVQGPTVDLMMVDVDHHRGGIGAWLLRDAEARLFRDHSRLSLESFRDNLQAIRFYEKHGWVAESQFVDADYGIPMTRMIKDRG